MINTLFVQVVILISCLFFMLVSVSEKRFKDKVLYAIVGGFMLLTLLYSMQG